MSATQVLEVTRTAVTMRGVGLSTDRETDKRIGAALHADLTYRIIGSAMRVHNKLGPGLKEAFYQRALSAELAAVGMDFTAEQPIEISVAGTYIGQLYIDHLVANTVIVEEKAVPHLLTNEEVAQVITYLNATGKPLGLLLNFGRRSLEFKRIFPPRNPQPWRDRIKRYVWVPPQHRSVYPFLESVDRQPR
jgi:GxxExxY protein